MVLLDYRWHRHGGDKSRREKKIRKKFQISGHGFFYQGIVAINYFFPI